MSIFASLVEPVMGLLDKVIPDTNQKAKLAYDIATMAERYAHENAQSQLEVAKQEAAHKSLFVAGWRPAVGWTCAFALAGNYLFIPMANFTLTLVGNPVQVPLLDLETMMPVLLGMLGLGGFRSFEKMKGVAREK